MTAAAALAELEELDRFLSALTARQYLGDHICCAVQPDTVHGSPEDLIARGVEGAAAVSGGWADQVVAALEGRQTDFEIRAALQNVAGQLDVAAFARQSEELILRSLMLGVLDSQWERENDEEIAPARFANDRSPRFVYLPFTQAIDLFERRKVLPPAAFKALEEAARRRAFTVAGLAKQELLDATHAELVRQLRAKQLGEGGGANLRDFQKFAKESLEKAGWTPTNPSHVETIFRTNGMSAVASGRAVEMSQPKVIAALPYWQIRGVTDARQRKTHAKAHGIVLPANHPFWRTAYPPFGFNCRCRVCARSKRWLEANGVTIGPVPQGLPDPGFESGTSALISVPPATLQPTPQPAPAPPIARPPIPGRPPVPARTILPPPQQELPFFPTQPVPLPSPSVAPPMPGFRIPSPEALVPPAKPLLGPISEAEIRAASEAGKEAARKAKKFIRQHPDVKALESYTGGGFREVNAALRDPGTVPIAELRAAVKKGEAVERLLADARKAGHVFEGVVQRGEELAKLPAQVRELYQSVHAGDDLVFSSFTSTTTRPRVAENFSDGVLMRIRQRTGVPVSQGSLMRHEQEVLLSPGTRFRVLRRFEEGGNIVLDLEQL